MRNIFSSIFALIILLTVGLACDFTTANLSEITFASDEANAKTFTSVAPGEKIYAHSSIKNAGGEHTIRWKVTNRDGKEIKLPENEIKVKGSRKIWLTLTLNPRVFSAGKYKFQLTLLDKDGEKEFESKTATLEVTE